MIGNDIYALAVRLWPINRSITGDGVRDTLSIIKNMLPDLKICGIPSGTKVFDWTIPKEWRAREAYIITPTGKKICDFKNNNLHLLGYSSPANSHLSLEELQEHLYSLPDKPNAIPYVTSYYKERWGFCISHQDRLKLAKGKYRIFIDTELFDGELNYGELIIRGESSKEIFISTYICHPSMANNELSGPTVTTFLAKRLQEQGKLKYSYRIIFIPETIGSIAYISQNLTCLQANVIAGFNVTCVGDNRNYSYLPSRNGMTLSDEVAKHVLKNLAPEFRAFSWSDRGSDERQYCAPGVDLPIASIMRTKYGEYEEYHTSLDSLHEVVTPDGLEGGFNAIWRAIEAIERNCVPRVKVLCEPQLGRRSLYPTLSSGKPGRDLKLMMDLITWSDGNHDLIQISDLCKCAIWDLYPIIDKLVEHDLLVLD
jgi:aminopeptidase-like protein